MCECVRACAASYAQIDYDRRRKEEFAYTWNSFFLSFRWKINPSRNVALISRLFICFTFRLPTVKPRVVQRDVETIGISAMLGR